MDSLRQTRDVIVWFFQKLRERGRDKTYLKPLDEMVRAMDSAADLEVEPDVLHELNNKAIELIKETMDREQQEFPMKPELSEEQLKFSSQIQEVSD